MWELDCEEGWAPKNWWFWTVVLEKTLESFLDCKEIQPVHPKGDQSWVFIGRTDAKAETPVLWPPHAKSWLIGKEEVKLSLFADDMILYISSVQFSHSVVSNSLRAHGLQHSRPPCPSPTPRVYPNSSCPLSRWCHLTISSSVVLFSSCPQSFPGSESFPVSQLFKSGGQILEL